MRRFAGLPTSAVATPIATGLPFLGAGADPARLPDSGASTPAASHDTITAQRLDDAIACIRSQLPRRSRHADWAAQALSGSVSLAAHDALGRKLIDPVAVD